MKILQRRKTRLLAFLKFFNIKMLTKSKNTELSEEFIVMWRNEQSLWDVMSSLFRERSEKRQKLEKIEILDWDTQKQPMEAFIKKGVSKTFSQEKFTKKNLCQIPFLIMLQVWLLAQVFSCEFCEIFSEHLFYWTPPGECFWIPWRSLNFSYVFKWVLKLLSLASPSYRRLMTAMTSGVHWVGGIS